jgi:hypothetical protein
MTRAIRERVTVEHEGVIEIHHPELAVGIKAEVIVLVEPSAEEDRPLVSFFGQAKGLFADANEVDSFLRAERESWDR